MLTPQRAQKNVLSAIAYAASCFSTWQKRVDATRHLMYRKEEPLASIAGYFEYHSKTDRSPVRRFTGRFVARCLRSRAAVCFLTNVPFEEVSSSLPLMSVQPHPDVTFEEIDTIVQEAHDDLDVYYDASTGLDDAVEPLEAQPQNFIPIEEGTGLNHVFVFQNESMVQGQKELSDDNSHVTSSPTTPQQNFEGIKLTTPEVEDVETTPQHKSSDTSLTIPDAETGSDCSKGASSDSDDEAEIIKAEPHYFVPVEEGTGLNHVFVFQNQVTAEDQEDSYADNLDESSAPITPPRKSADTSLTTPDIEPGSGRFKVPDNDENADPASEDGSEEDNLLGEDEILLREDKMLEEDVLLEENDILKEENANLLHEKMELEREKDQLLKENEILIEANANLVNGKIELERQKGHLEVEVTEHNCSIKRHIETNNVLEKENRGLKTNWTQFRTAMSRDNEELYKMVADLDTQVFSLKTQNTNLEAQNSDLEAQAQGLGIRSEDQEVLLADRELKIANYEKGFQRYKVEWKGASETIEELRQTIRAFPDHPKAMLEAIAKRDSTIARLKDNAKANRVWEKAINWAYPKLHAKYNVIVGLANERLDVGVVLSQRLAEMEAVFQKAGCSSPMSNRDAVWDQIHKSFRINPTGLWDQDENGEWLMVPRETEIAETPNDWLPDLLKELWNEEGDFEEQEDKAGTEAADFQEEEPKARVKEQGKLTWLENEEENVVKTNEKGKQREVKVDEENMGSFENYKKKGLEKEFEECPFARNYNELNQQRIANQEKILAAKATKVDETSSYDTAEDTDPDDIRAKNDVLDTEQREAEANPDANEESASTTPSEAETEIDENVNPAPQIPNAYVLSASQPSAPQSSLTTTPKSAETEQDLRTGKSKTHKRNAQRKRARALHMEQKSLRQAQAQAQAQGSQE